MDRRRFLRMAVVRGAAGLSASEAMSAVFAQARSAQVPPAQPHAAQVHAPATPSRTRHIERFAKRLDLIRQSLDVPGMSVAVLHKQAVLLARGFGVADVAARTRATESTPYPIASVTKTFATAVIMKLVEQGKLDLDEPVSSYDHDYAQWCASLKTLNGAASVRGYSCDTARITLRHHLTHTAQGTPGANFEYNAFLFGRLTAVIDAVSPRGYQRSLEEDILDPLGMKDTALGTKDSNKPAVVARMAKPYRLDADGNLSESGAGRSFDRISASSGIISTVADLARYDVGIDHDLVYSPQAKQQVWTPAVTRSGAALPYGLGWFVQGEPGGKGQFVWHYGQYPSAFSSLLFKVPDRHLTFIFLACTERASSVFSLGNGDPLRSAFVSAFVDEFAGYS